MLDGLVKKARFNIEMRSDYMKELTLAMDLRDEGREEGIEIGREEGIEIGREEERANTEKANRRADAAEAENAILLERLRILEEQVKLLSEKQ